MTPGEACSYKRRYGTKEVAKKWAARARGRGHAAHLHVYRCPVEGCGGWHLTSGTAEMRAAERQRVREGRR
jgi:hypothetical protein